MATIWATLVALKEWAAAIAALLGFARQVADTVQTESDKASGRAEAEAAQAQVGKQVEAEIANEAARPVSEDDAIARMKAGDA